MKKTSIRNPLLLFLAAVVWGVAFVAQSVGTEYIGAFTFNCVRCLIGGVTLLPVIALTGRLQKREEGPGASFGSEKGKPGVPEAGKRSQTSPQGGKWNRATLQGGVCCGVLLFVAGNLQQIGIQYTTVGKAGFITALYIVLVPLTGLFLKKKVPAQVWAGVALAVAGLYLLCITEDFSLGKGDALVLFCAFCFTVHILTVDHFSADSDGVRMACIQFFVCGLLSGAGMLLLETPSLTAIAQAALPVGYAGIFSCGVGYTLQIVGQKGMNPTIASLILSLESVVSVLAGWLLLGQKLSMRELGGCVLMFAAIILAQLPQRKLPRAEKSGA